MIECYLMLNTEQWFEVQARKNFYNQYRYGLDANGELDYNTDEIIPLTGEFAAYYNEKFDAWSREMMIILPLIH